jgi:betaine-aldehyde dehydrogenase
MNIPRIRIEASNKSRRIFIQRILNMSFKSQLFIDGKWVDPVLKGTFENRNPADDTILGQVANATKEDIDVAVAAARKCLESDHWGYKSTGAQRAVILRRLGEIISSRQEEIAQLDSLDQGKPIREARADLADSIAACTHFAKLAEEQDSHQNEVIDNGTDGAFITTVVLEPIGVIGAITPWNYPFLMSIWKVIPCIAAGCTMVLKPSELAPLSSLLLGELCFEAGLPAGALNVVAGLGPDAGAPLSNHPGVDKLSFTGSQATGSRIMAAASAGPRAVSMELGGKSPLIVFEDADINGAVDWIITGILWNTGQVCSATSRVLVHSGIREALLARLLERVKAIKIGNQQSEEFRDFQGASMGPVVSRPQYDKIWAAIDEAKAAGHVLLYGGDRESVSHLGAGYYVPPTIFVDVPTTSRVWTEEIFGPVLAVREFMTEDEAVRLANDSEYGLAGAVFSADAERCDRVGRNLRVGILWKNCCQPAFIQAPWGGVKRSGFGRELGRWGMEEFTAVKQVTGCVSGYSWELY